jgi:hypothetical protein
LTNSNDQFTARIFGTDTISNGGTIGETGIRICQKGGGSLISNSTKALDVYSNGSSKMVVTGSGNVGIGTSNPGTALQITSSSGLRLTNTEIKSSANDRFGYIDFENDGTGAAIESCVDVSGASNNAYLRFMTSLDYNNTYVERMRIDRSGNVGIGTTSPDVRFEVVGNIDLTNPNAENLGNAIAKFTANDVAGVV